VLACLEQLAVDAKDAVMIGDSAADTGAARAAGLPVALVTYGYSREPVATLGADALVDRLEQIPALLAQLHGKRAR
jgi:phosphoglycolate phosphatase